jgi:RNase P/RNase MRP subunit p29
MKVPLMGYTKKSSSLAKEYNSKFLSLNNLKFISNKFVFNNQQVRVIESRNFRDVGVSGLILRENFTRLLIRNDLDGRECTVYKKGLILELTTNGKVFLINFTRFSSIRKRFGGLPRNVTHFVGVE